MLAFVLWLSSLLYPTNEPLGYPVAEPVSRPSFEPGISYGQDLIFR